MLFAGLAAAAAAPQCRQGDAVDRSGAATAVVVISPHVGLEIGVQTPILANEGREEEFLAWCR
jgi:hypothetical protein